MGSRQHDGATKFYSRHRDDGASRLGAMVGEIEAALDALHCLAPGAAATLPECADGSSHVPPYGPLDVPPLDPTAVHLLGYSMGSIIALHAAALLPQIASVAAGCATIGTTMRMIHFYNYCQRKWRRCPKIKRKYYS